MFACPRHVTSTPEPICDRSQLLADTQTTKLGPELGFVMAEARRVPLTTLARHGPPPSFTSDEIQPDPPAHADTVRLVLTLFEPDEQSFPEFSYSQLVDGKVGLAL